jgi:hypothetical protein
MNNDSYARSGFTIMNAKNESLINFRYNNNTAATGYFGMARNNPGDGDLYYDTRYRFLQYSYDSSTKARLSYAEYYDLPTVTAGLTETKSYTILTTKNLTFSITGNASTATTAYSYASSDGTYYIGTNGSANLNGVTTNSNLTCKSGLVISNAKNTSVIYFLYNNNTQSSAYLGVARDNPGDGDLYYTTRFRFLQYSYNSSTKAMLSTYEYFDLPIVTADRASSASH